MKRMIASILLVSLSLASLRAQETVPLDSLAIENYDVFTCLSDSVTVHQSPEVASALNSHIRRNARLVFLGLEGQTFGIRIFSDNSQGARGAWDAIATSFQSRFPGVPVSKTFEAPFFKVTVGNYSTKADANAALKRIQPEYPSAFIVRN